jgi:hypothetical protein
MTGLNYIVGEQDCISSIAEAHGFFWKTVWDHARNAMLKELRKDPNVLLAGDQVFIPELTIKELDGATGKRHKFRRLGTPAIARFRFLQDGKPRQNVPYILQIDGQSTAGNTDPDGCIQFPIPPTANGGTLLLGQGVEARSYNLMFGAMDPISTKSGARKRLIGLGFDCGLEEDSLRFEKALKVFQSRQSLRQTGALDESTQKALQKAFGC